MRCHGPHDVAGVLDGVDLSDSLADDHVGVVEVVGLDGVREVRACGVEALDQFSLVAVS